MKTVAIAPIVISPGSVIPESKSEVKILEFKFGHLTPAELIDALGPIERLVKDLEKWANAGREVLKTKIAQPKEGMEIVEHGKTFLAVYSYRSRSFLSKTKLVAEFGEEWVDQFMDVTEYQELRIKPAETLNDAT